MVFIEESESMVLIEFRRSTHIGKNPVGNMRKSITKCKRPAVGSHSSGLRETTDCFRLPDARPDCLALVAGLIGNRVCFQSWTVDFRGSDRIGAANFHGFPEFDDLFLYADVFACGSNR